MEVDTGSADARLAWASVMVVDKHRRPAEEMGSQVVGTQGLVAATGILRRRVAVDDEGEDS